MDSKRNEMFIFVHVIEERGDYVFFQSCRRAQSLSDCKFIC